LLLLAGCACLFLSGCLSNTMRGVGRSIQLVGDITRNVTDGIGQDVIDACERSEQYTRK